MHALIGGRPLRNRQSRTPFLGRANGTWSKTPAAVRALIMEFVLGAIGTERALIAADPRMRGIGRKIPVAVFAVWPKLQRHDLSRVRGHDRKSAGGCDD